MVKEYVPYDGPLVSKKEAKENNLDRYFTGKSCVHGHVDQRATSHGRCLQCERNRSSDYYRNNKSTHLNRCMNWASRNKELVSKTNKAWIERNREQLRQAARNRRRDRPEAVRDSWKKWAAKNPEILKAISANRRARKLSAPGKYTKTDIKRIFMQQRGKCGYCNKSLESQYHIDHIQPLSKGGTNFPNNLQLLCPSCNQKKHATDPILFARRLGKLL